VFKTLTFALFISTLITGCKEQSFSSKDSESSIILKKLNKSDYTSVISTLENKKESGNLSIEDRYLMASAFAIKGGMDVYSLFPLMEVELFHKRAIDWSELEEQRNPYGKFLINKTTSSASVEERKEAWQKYIEASLSAGVIEALEFDCTEYENEELCEDTRDRYEQLREDIKAENYYYSELDPYQLNKVKVKVDEVVAFTQHLSDSNDDDDFVYSEQIIFNDLEDHYRQMVTLDYKKDLFISGELKDEKSEIHQQLMKFLWSVYESIPLIQRLPKIDDNGQSTLNTVLEILKDNMSEDPTHEKSSKMIVMTLFFSVSSIFADSFDLQAVDSPISLGCNIKEKTLLGHLKILRDRVKYVRELGEMGLLDEHVSQDNFESIRNYLDTSEDSISETDKEKLFRSIRDYKIKNCGPSIFLLNS
tara:strand:+ start:95957 stop:97216 length:1260 start_codon:yes stop_codon:yes gene_type:complete